MVCEFLLFEFSPRLIDPAVLGSVEVRISGAVREGFDLTVSPRRWPWVPTPTAHLRSFSVTYY